MLSAPDFNERSGDIAADISVDAQSQKTEKAKHYPKEQIILANKINVNEDHLYAGDKKQLKKFKVKLKDFKKSLPDSSDTKLIIKK